MRRTRGVKTTDKQKEQQWQHWCPHGKVLFQDSTSERTQCASPAFFETPAENFLIPVFLPVWALYFRFEKFDPKNKHENKNGCIDSTVTYLPYFLICGTLLRT